MLTHGILPDFRGGVHYFFLNRHTPSGQYRVNRVSPLLTDGVPCRKSAGTGPVVLKVVPVNGCCHFAGHHGPIHVRLRTSVAWYSNVISDRFGLAQPHECSSKTATRHATVLCKRPPIAYNVYRGHNCCTTHVARYICSREPIASCSSSNPGVTTFWHC